MSIAKRKLEATQPTGEGREAPQDLGVAFGQHTTIAADDTIVTGLSRVEQVVVSLEDDLLLTVAYVTGVIGDQAGAPAAGSIQIKTFRPTSAIDATPIAATVFGKKVNWIAYGAI